MHILKTQPLLIVVIPTTGAMFFYGCGAIIGNNTIEKVLVTTVDAFALPMKGVVIIWNSYGNMAFKKVFGMPVIINMTQTFKIGLGYTLKKVYEYASIGKESAFSYLFRTNKSSRY